MTSLIRLELILSKILGWKSSVEPRRITSPSPSPAGDRQCHQGRPRPGSGRSSSTWGGRWWTWWGRRPDCTCQYHWLASRRSWWEGWEAGRVPWLRAAVTEPGWCLSRRDGQSSLWAGCPLRHWLCRSACSRCGIWRRPANINVFNTPPNLPQLPWFGSFGWNGLYLGF